METFTIGLRSPWWIRVLHRKNPLVRSTDRIEAMTIAIAVIVTVFAIPIAAAIGTSVHGDRAGRYAAEAQTRHQLIATATEKGHVVLHSRVVDFSAEAIWSDAGRTHRDVVSWPGPVNISDRQSIWVNNDGENVGHPSPPSRADGEAIGVALLIWLGVAEFSTAMLYVVRRRLNRSRYAQWDREINPSPDYDSRRNHQT
ncbi:hypothetical protein [Mycobacterium sp. OAE908]|uniref:Rv1733c family protein n=1 Tax=Mycobacterium sp. OAE908 TaxID=2817899 RepID=UPI001AE82107